MSAGSPQILRFLDLFTALGAGLFGTIKLCPVFGSLFGSVVIAVTFVTLFSDLFVPSLLLLSLNIVFEITFDKSCEELSKGVVNIPCGRRGAGVGLIRLFFCV